MDNTAIQIFLLLLGLGGWLYCSFPTLRGMVDISEGRFRWSFLLWFILLIASIFLIKFALYSLSGWPRPGSWASRLFFGIVLISAYLVPFIKEMLVRKFRS